MIAVIDYGMGNLRSVQKALQAVGADARVSSSSKVILDAHGVVLPGVGAFKDCMVNLERMKLVEVIHQVIRSGRPFLGICLGLQLLFSQSEEFGKISGLGVLPGKVVRFPNNLKDGDSKLKIPHMGWNQVHLNKPMSLFRSVPNNSYFYFVHSYYVIPENLDTVATTTHYGSDFVSGIQHENVTAFQFHPEKSQKQGLAILEDFSNSL